MKFPSQIVFLSLLLGIQAAQSSPLRLRQTCNGCAPGEAKAIDSSFDAELDRYGFKRVDSSVVAPTLKIVAYPDGGTWFLCPTLLSPKGAVVSVSREEFAGLPQLLGPGVDSALALARRTVNEAVTRAKRESKLR